MYKITVIDLDTGETCVDDTVRCICAGTKTDDETGAGVLTCGGGTALDYVRAMLAAENAIQQTLKTDPAIRAAYQISKIPGIFEED